jgi:DNA gyrase inhibitor
VLLLFNPYIIPPDKCRYDAGLVLPEQDTSISALLNTRKIHAGKYIVYTYKITLHSLNNIWEDIFSLNLSESGYQIKAKPIIER